ncbi:uncharacterized protein AC631_02135 [Debaryomyces fabryi]|uniref:SPS-sensor component PTR3 n=1 Tax=Debaryomyces fabryi TaxID=58627 RepID=A0A0V1Q0Y0_9ASCO|nr:uncharacterized protein AC631_02135 [Debaryomyces fabryi]KSA02139.1 hypothetical protein AC631_02135 [Debaryomyces fabryi]CUM55366.1 unnamed protein product [Debaryomyces fabryi]
MDKLKVSSLEGLLKFKAGSSPNVIVSDASVLTCGCLVSESYFLSYTSNSETNESNCPNCQAKNVSILTEITPLRDLFGIIQEINIHLNNKNRRRSSSKKSIRSNTIDHNESSSTTESMDLISLFYKFAKEEASYLGENNSEVIEDINPKALTTTDISEQASSTQNYIFPETKLQTSESLLTAQPLNDQLSFEQKLLTNLSEEKEYNFSKCFPFHRKLSTFQTQQSKFNISSITKGSIMKKTASFICSDIHTYCDFGANCEVTRFVLISNKKWELYEYRAYMNQETYSAKPVLLCCGKLTGEYGRDFNNLRADPNSKEVVIKNDFANGQNSNTNSGRQSNDEEKKKRLDNWDQIFCKLSTHYLVISGTKGVMRVLNVSSSSLPEELGRPMYMYITNFPIRCISVSPNESLVACGITAKERLSSKEQPFIILHKLNPSLNRERAFDSVEPITITIPYRDPIKLINFNATSTHLLCCTVWESRYLIIKLRNKRSDNYKRPRLVWTELAYTRHHRVRNTDTNDVGTDDEQSDDFQLMDDEGITDLQFGALSANVIFLTSCSLKDKPSYVLKLEGEIGSRSHASPFVGHNNSIDNQSQDISLLSSLHSIFDEENHNSQASNISGSETIMKIPEIGSSIHKLTLLPRGDAMVFLDKAGHVFLVSTPNFQHLKSSIKKVVVQLGEVANAARYTEAASLKFSSDGGKVYAVDRKGVFQVYDFTKGIPGHDSDVIKCKIINV